MLMLAPGHKDLLLEPLTEARAFFGLTSADKIQFQERKSVSRKQKRVLEELITSFILDKRIISRNGSK